METKTFKTLYTFTGIQQHLCDIIEKTHSQDMVTETTDKKGNPVTVTIKAIKNRQKMYPKYVYLIHSLLIKAKHEPELYKSGVPLSRNEFAKRTGSKTPVASLIFKTLQEFKIIYQVKKASVQMRKGRVKSAKSSTYKFTAFYEEKLELFDEKVTTETFNRKDHGLMIDKLLRIEEKYEVFTKSLDEAINDQEALFYKVEKKPVSEVGFQVNENGELTKKFEVPVKGCSEQGKPVPTAEPKPSFPTKLKQSIENDPLTKPEAFNTISRMLEDEGCDYKGPDFNEIKSNVVALIEGHIVLKNWKDKLSVWLDEYINTHLLITKPPQRKVETNDEWLNRKNKQQAEKERAGVEHRTLFDFLDDL